MDSITNALNQVVDLVAAAVPIMLALVLVGLLVRRYAKPPQVVISEFECDEKLCPSQVLCAVMVTEITSAGSGRLVERVADSSSVTPLDFAALAGDRAKWLAALLQAVSLRRKVRVSGIAFAVNDHEVVLNVSIANTKNVVAQSRSFAHRHPEKSPQVLLRENVADAASWALYRLTELLGHGVPENLGTRDWRSWGRFRCAVWRQEQGMVDDARNAYSEAVVFDPDNWGAWINFGSLDSRANPRRALSRLLLADELLRRGRSPTLEPGYYRLAYLIGIVHLNCSLHRDLAHERAFHQQEAVRVVSDLVRCSAEFRLRLEEPGTGAGADLVDLPDPQSDDLKSTIGTTQPTAIALLASARVNAGEPLGGPIQEASGPVTHDVWRVAQSELASMSPDAKPNELLGLLRRLMADEQFYPGVDYNLACMYSRALATARDVDHGLSSEQITDAAFRHLERAVENRDRARIAELDDAFTRLRAADRERFAGLVTSRLPLREQEPSIERGSELPVDDRDLKEPIDA